MKRYLLLMAAMLPLVFAGCGDDEDEFELPAQIALYVDEDYNLGATGAVSENTFVASVKDGKVRGEHVGTTKISVLNRKIDVKVKGHYSLYDDPVTDWGCSISEVKARHKQGTLGSKSTSEMIVYENAGSANLIGYTFKNGKLNGVAVYLPSSVGSQISYHLMERYFMIPNISGYNSDVLAAGYDAYDEKSATTGVSIINKNNQTVNVVYLPIQK